MIIGEKRVFEGIALVDIGAWYTVIDKELAEEIGVKYTDLVLGLTSFSGHRVRCDEALVNSLRVEEKTAPFELVAICTIPGQVKELLRKLEVSDRIIIGIHTLERLGYMVDPVTHRLIESPDILML